MIYQRSKEIEQRLSEVLRLVRSGKYSTPRLAQKLGVSIPTVSRCIESLRGRGHQIRSRNTGRGWRYVLDGKPVRNSESGSGLAERTGPMSQPPEPNNATERPGPQ